MQDSADAALIDSVLSGNESAFEDLVRSHQGSVWGMAYRTLGNSAECEDAVQETFLRAYVSLKRFDRRYPFGPWLLRIASNYCIDQLRRRKSRKYTLWCDLGETEQERLLTTLSSNGPIDHPVTEDPEKQVRIVQSLLNQLKPERRMAFVLRELEGRDYHEVAEILGTSMRTARVRVSRARADLQSRLRRYLATLRRRDHP
jgi:RNA polymerase sigma-70 factor (ECF subfamily)